MICAAKYNQAALSRQQFECCYHVVHVSSRDMLPNAESNLSLTHTCVGASWLSIIRFPCFRFSIFCSPISGFFFFKWKSTMKHASCSCQESGLWSRYVNKCHVIIWDFFWKTAAVNDCVQNMVFLNELSRGTRICERVIQSIHTT